MQGRGLRAASGMAGAAPAPRAGKKAADEARGPPTPDAYTSALALVEPAVAAASALSSVTQPHRAVSRLAVAKTPHGPADHDGFGRKKRRFSPNTIWQQVGGAPQRDENAGLSSRREDDIGPRIRLRSRARSSQKPSTFRGGPSVASRKGVGRRRSIPQLSGNPSMAPTDRPARAPWTLETCSVPSEVLLASVPEGRRPRAPARRSHLANRRRTPEAKAADCSPGLWSDPGAAPPGPEASRSPRHRSRIACATLQSLGQESRVVPDGPTRPRAIACPRGSRPCARRDFRQMRLQGG